MASVREIAEAAGFSITTVSRVLNNDPSVNSKTRKNILAIANRTGYVANVGKRATNLLGFCYTGSRTLSHPFDAAVLEGLARGASELHFDVMLLNLRRDKRPEETYTQFFMRKGVRGAVIRTMHDTRDICIEIAKEGFPTMVISERFDEDFISCIDCDSKPDSIRAVEYLIRLGHRRIAFAMHNMPDRDHMDRLEGYHTALAAADVPLDESLVLRLPYTLTGGASVMQILMGRTDPPTAIYFADPMLAVGAFKQAQEMGIRIPEDVSIIGFDDTNIRHSVHPTMTSICQDAGTLGLEAARQLATILTVPGNRCYQGTVPTFFEVHESTAPPGKEKLGVLGNGHRNGLHTGAEEETK